MEDITNGLEFFGDYSAAKTYKKNNLVYFNGSCYFCVRQSVGIQPDKSVTFWKLFCKQGGPGPVGPVGPAGTSLVTFLPFGKLTATAAASTAQLDDESITFPGDESGWEVVGSSKVESITFDFKVPVLVTHFFCTFRDGQSGLKVRIQASNSKKWTDVHVFNPARFLPVTPDGFRNYSDVINVAKTYRYYRIISDPCPKLFYSYIQFFGTC
jgi:hypothetical protein